LSCTQNLKLLEENSNFTRGWVGEVEGEYKIPMGTAQYPMKWLPEKCCHGSAGI